MILDWVNRKANDGLDDMPYKLVDGRGVEICLPIRWADTETGRIRCVLRGYDGEMYESAEDGRLLEADVRLKPPLRVWGKSGVEVTAVPEPMIIKRDEDATD